MPLKTIPRPWKWNFSWATNSITENIFSKYLIIRIIYISNAQIWFMCSVKNLCNFFKFISKKIKILSTIHGFKQISA